MFKVAIVGRPNVGKTTLFNKIIGNKIAITHDTPGITRDRKEFDVNLSDMKIRLIDTAGIDERVGLDAISKQMNEQSHYAIGDSDLCILVLDGKRGITPEDISFVRILQKRKKDDFIVLINKGENLSISTIDGDFYKLGLSSFIIVSAEHNIGMHELLLELRKKYEKYIDKYGDIDLDRNSDIIQVAVVGRPNAGKSTFINSLLKINRLIVTPIAGTTRDAIPIDFEYMDRKIRIIDTAGIRKRMNIADKVEELSVAESFRAIDFAHIVILLIDIASPLDKQDIAIASRVIDEGRMILFCINKCDTIPEKNKKQITSNIEAWFNDHKNMNYGSFFILSAKYDNDLNAILDDVVIRYDKWSSQISTSKLNNWLRDFVDSSRQLPIIKGRRMKLKFISQVQTRPPYFKISSNFSNIPENYVSYIKNGLIEYFDLQGINIRLGFKKADNPFKNKK